MPPQTRVKVLSLPPSDDGAPHSTPPTSSPDCAPRTCAAKNTISRSASAAPCGLDGITEVMEAPTVPSPLVTSQYGTLTSSRLSASASLSKA